ncbi:hypothetical protein [Acinetobacter pittii]|uniref:Uncharacterized protein n=1 Tax=Acinetobacter pittii TaxID=48296 RepID=A0AAE9M797_ACIPI|nr:hypothetical protein [Acinetobacter pittii]USU94158.1 hypothetical protein MWH18_17770 [Acinetobacter pittii]
MSHKTIKPDLDLVFARFAIFGMLAILFAAISVKGDAPWFTWVVMLWGVFSIFEAAIKADEDALAANGLAKIIISHSGKLASERDELKKSIQGNHGRIAELERLNRVKVQTILDLHEEIKELKASHHGEMIGHEVHLKQVKKNRDQLRVRVDSLEQALNKVSDWKAHPEGYEANFGAWGVRDFYRSLAKQALAKKE